MTRPKPTQVPRTPALVRRGIAAVAVGFGLSGVACGGELDSTPPDAGATGDGGAPADAVSEFPAPVFVPQPPPPLPAIDSGSSVDAGPDVFITPLPPPLPPPPSPLPPLPAMDAGFTSDATLDAPPPPPPLPVPIRAPYWPELDASDALDSGNEPPPKP